jgi:lipid II:glycine glycyltransferase (peptidoglycan interpeptide bridge formation enzyme)
MEIKIFQESDKSVYADFIKNNSADGGLLQSWNWGEFQKKMNHDVTRYGLYNDEGILISAFTLLCQKFAYIAKKYYLPRGPIVTKEILENKEKLKELLYFVIKKIEDKAFKQKVMFLRMDPPWQTFMVKKELLKDLGMQKAKRQIQPVHTLYIPLKYDFKDLLKQMKQKTRYNIRLAEKKGVNIEIVSGEKGVNDFYDLLSKTSQRKGFKPHKKEYFEKLSEVFDQTNQIKFVNAYYHGELIVSNLVLNYNRIGYYLLGGSDKKYKNMMAPYLAQYRTIIYLKEIGCKFYDLWGVSSYNKEIIDKRETDWEGFSRFKKGFAPNEPIIEFIGAWEYPFNNLLYNFFNILK